MVAVVAAVGDDDVIEELDAHDGAGLLDASRQVVVGLAGAQAPAGVVVTNGQDGGVA